MEQRALIVFGLSLLAFIIIINFVNHSINESTKEIPTNIVVQKQPAAEIALPARISMPTHELIPEDPAKYGIIEQDLDELPKNEIQWDEFMKKAIVENKVLEEESAKPALTKMQKSPEEYQKKKEDIQSRIEMYEKIKNDNPSDEEAEKHLQALYMLKSLSKVLEKKVVTSP